MLSVKEKIQILSQLGKEILLSDQLYRKHLSQATARNGWFTEENIVKSLEAIAQSYLSEGVLNGVCQHYYLDRYNGGKRVGLVLAGNIPLVGFHDILCTFLSNHTSVVKLSDKDAVLIPILVNRMIEIDSRVAEYFQFVDRLKDFNAVIATGSNSTAGYFESYFSAYPHIIRKNRNGLAILSGNESKTDIVNLGKDIYDYFGLGCRNVSHLLLPEEYDFDFLMGTLHDHYKHVILHNKYKNNFDFNYATWLMNKVDFLMNGSLLVKEDDRLPSSIASLHYSYYSNEEDAVQRIEQWTDQIQCVVGQKETWKPDSLPVPFFEFGKAQEPKFMDYADSVDTLQFLIGL
jgi:hypothetical protein